jgi:hypothetical protein
MVILGGAMFLVITAANNGREFTAAGDRTNNKEDNKSCCIEMKVWIR